MEQLTKVVGDIRIPREFLDEAISAENMKIGHAFMERWGIDITVEKDMEAFKCVLVPTRRKQLEDTLSEAVLHCWKTHEKFTKEMSFPGNDDTVGVHHLITAEEEDESTLKLSVLSEVRPHQVEA